MTGRVRGVRPTVAVLGALIAGLAAAHDGHDHGGAPAAAVSPGPAGPVLEAVSATFELVAVPDPRAGTTAGDLVITLDRTATNEPVLDAAVEGTADGTTSRAVPAPDGTYRLPAPWSQRPGRTEVMFTILTGEDADVLIGTLDVPEPAGPPSPGIAAAAAATLAARVRQEPALALGALVVFLCGALTGLMLTRRGRSRKTAAAGLVAIALLAATGTAFAHEGEDHGTAPAPTAPAPAAPAPAGTPAVGAIPLPDPPRRLPDGSLYVPKRTQRLLAIRTMVAVPAAAVGTVSLNGRVIADPNYAGHVQASQSGRIEPGERGLPYLGQRVEAGQILAYVVPAVTAVDRSAVRQQIAQIDKDIAIARARVERLTTLAGTVPKVDLEEARKTMLGLEHQREALLPALTAREALAAPLAGVVADSAVKIGQFVDGRDQVLVEIIDPTRLMVEAIAFDADAVTDLAGATAATTDGKRLDLEPVGLGPALRHQGIPLLFRIVTVPAGLKVGQPVTVLVPTAARVAGLPVPRRSVVRHANGQSVVFEHTAPQRFAVRPVRLSPVDPDTILVVEGLADGARIVTDGAGLLNQIR